ncbi:uncharacterized protein LOC132754726 [Ruditapes philippinarum]|uniref:uncharacterized protein LOC132754726 n=1 Tax=Ruditapes philippinarum TaxID=129788 RepID=UPI00295B4695|nr:uncharacterized protein LOC132754726 [Ruditapes philippinarum]
MYLYLVNFLRLLHGLCLLYIVIGVQSGIAVSRRRSLTEESKRALFVSEHMKITFIGKKMAELEEKLICSDALCAVSQDRKDRKKRNTRSDLTNAQNKQTETNKENKPSEQSSATKYAFGNPALPSQTKTRNGKPKSKRRKG